MVPAVCLFVLAGLARQFNFVQSGQLTVPESLYAVIFVLSAISALAGPILIRTLFANATQGEARVSSDNFLSFQKRLLGVSLISPYLAFMAYLFDFPRFHAGAVLLMAMYAVYYYFPSEKRIVFDRKIFRVE